MSKTPDDRLTDSTALELQKKTVAVTIPARTFRDKVYTSRTLILPNGATLPVAKGRVSAFGDDQLHYLSTHPDFEPLTE